MAKNQNTVEKRRREMAKKRKQEEKREERRRRKEQPDVQADVQTNVDPDEQAAAEPNPADSS